MTIQQELALSFYRQVADIDAEHNVFLVQDTRNGKFFVKKLLTVYNAEIYRYLIEHPVAGTPRIFLAEEDRGILTVIEEYIPGDTLEELLEQSGTLSEERAVDIALQLCKILSSFHGCTPPIVNRDIKPSNIKITPDGAVKLVDMNAARRSSGHDARDTVLLGTQGYAAPEQYGFGSSGVQTDIYSVGVLLNVMLTGELPAQRTASGSTGRVIARCVELSPADRYQSTGELQAALTALTCENTAPSTPNPKELSGPMRFLPPGFRSGNIIKCLFSALGYLTIFSLGLSLEVENAGPAELILNRIMFTLSVLCIVLFNGNYLNVQQHFILTRSPNKWVRWIGMAVVDTAIVTLWLLLMDILISIFVR